MNILILGAGQVGGTLAEHLASEDFDITLVDTDEARLTELRRRLDIRTVPGHASRPDVLDLAGAKDADMLIAVTPNDEVNMVACQVCYSMFRTPMKIARIRADAYQARSHLDDEEETFFSREHMPIDVLINPERVVTEQIAELLQHPGTTRVVDFADGRVKLVAMKAGRNGPLVGQALGRHMRDVEARVAAIFRRDRPIIPQDDTIIEADDDVFFLAAAAHIPDVMAKLGRAEKRTRRVFVAGGGRIGENLARAIQPRFAVTVLEHDERRANELAKHLDSAIVIHGDATDRELLLEEGIERADAFCAVTEDDEVNIMSSLLSKRLGARRAMTLIGKPAYVELMDGGAIDVALSPKLTTAGTILQHVRRGDVVRVHSLRHGAAEALEAVVHETSKLAGRPAGQLPLPQGTTLGAVVRGEAVLIPHDDLTIAPDDHVILFLTDKGHIRAVERLFQVGPSFF